MVRYTTPTLLASWLRRKQLDVILLVSGNTTGKEDGMNFSIVHDEGYHALVVAEIEISLASGWSFHASVELGCAQQAVLNVTPFDVV